MYALYGLFRNCYRRQSYTELQQNYSQPNNSYTLNNPRYNIISEKKISRGPPKSLQSSQHEIKSPLKDKYTPYISFSFFLLGFYLYHDNYLHNALRD